MIPHIDIPTEEFDAFCRRWKVAELAMKSTPHVGDPGPGLFVRFDPSADWSLPDRIRMEDEFHAMTGTDIPLQSRHVDTLRRGHPNSMRLLYNA